MTTPDELSALMDFDRVIRVHDGTATPADDVHAPTAYMSHEADDTWPIDTSELKAGGWTLLDGYSGQDRYSGPWMHQSEVIGGRMAEDILARPGLYVAIYPSMLTDDDEMADTWAIAYREEAS